MFFELKGVDPNLVANFSSRREVIERQVAHWKEEGNFVGVAHARLYEMAALETRDRKRKVGREDVERIFEQGFERCGTTSREVKHGLERARELALARGSEPPEYAAPGVIRLSAQRLIDKEAVLDRARLLDQAVLISGGRHSVRELNLAIEDQSTGVLRLGPNGRRREYYTTVGMRELEARNLETIRELSPFKPVTSKEELGAYLKTVEVELGAPLTAGQRTQVFNELIGECAVQATEGKAGAGKTFTAKVIEGFNREVLGLEGKEHFTIDVAFTARAAQEMNAASGRPACTIDTLLDAFARAWRGGSTEAGNG